MNTITSKLMKNTEQLAKIEKKLLELKKGSWFGMAKPALSLKGILKKINISEQDIKKAKKSLFKA